MSFPHSSWACCSPNSDMIHTTLCLVWNGLKSANGAELNSWVSSENLWRLSPESWTISESWWVQRTKSNGPRTGPWGTPKSSLLGTEEMWFTVKVISLSVTYRAGHWRARTVTQKRSWPASAVSWFTISKVADRSKRVRMETCPFVCWLFSLSSPHLLPPPPEKCSFSGH